MASGRTRGGRRSIPDPALGRRAARLGVLLVDRDGRATIALGKQVYDLTGRELDLGLLGLAELRPRCCSCSSPGRSPTGSTAAPSVAPRLGLEAVFCVAPGQGRRQRPHVGGPIFALVVGYGIAAPSRCPPRASLPADTVPPERLPWLVARQSVTWQAASIVGPVAAGFSTPPTSNCRSSWSSASSW